MRLFVRSSVYLKEKKLSCGIENDLKSHNRKFGLDLYYNVCQVQVVGCTRTLYHIATACETGKLMPKNDGYIITQTATATMVGGCYATMVDTLYWLLSVRVTMQAV